jgi:hypothetical protein
MYPYEGLPNPGRPIKKIARGPARSRIHLSAWKGIFSEVRQDEERGGALDRSRAGIVVPTLGVAFDRARVTSS